jgi:tripartite-type tricarboxylate transporter receptor subunit TctC
MFRLFVVMWRHIYRRLYAFIARRLPFEAANAFTWILARTRDAPMSSTRQISIWRIAHNLLVTMLVQAIVVSTVGAEVPSDFYQGKTVTLYIGAEPGGGYDLFARALGRHMAGYLPGRPVIVPMNMPGASSIVLSNFLAKTAPRDGTAIGAVSAMALFAPLFRGSQSMADFRGPEMTMIGNAAAAHWALIVRHSAGITSISDLREKQLVIGTTSPASEAYIITHAVKRILGLDHLKIVLGYRSMREVAGAVERGEVSGCVLDLEDIMAIRPKWLESGDFDVISQFSDSAMASAAFRAPAVTDLVAADGDREVLAAIIRSTTLARPVIAPPQVPNVQAKLLRDAFLATLNDSDFLSEAQKMKITIAPTSGEKMQDLVRKTYAMPPAILTRLRAILADE